MHTERDTMNQAIQIGRATVPAHHAGGWALPGRRRTESLEVAVATARAVADTLGSPPESVPAVRPRHPLIVRRRPAVDHRYLQSRA